MRGACGPSESLSGSNMLTRVAHRLVEPRVSYLVFVFREGLGSEAFHLYARAVAVTCVQLRCVK